MAGWRWEGLFPLSLVLDHVRPAYGGQTWDEALAYLASAPAEDAVIADLCASGPDGFEEPIRIYWTEPDDDDAADDGNESDADRGSETGVAPAVSDETDGSEEPGWVIGNGMHRVAAAVRLGLEFIACTPSGASEQESAEQEYVDMVFTLPPMTYSSELEPADQLDDLDWVCGWFRSFPLRDGTWVECDSFAGHGSELTGMWSCPASHAEALVEELHARWTRFAPSGCKGEFVVKSMRTITGAEWDAEFEAEFGDKYPSV